MRNFVSRITRLRPIAVGLAAGILVTGVLALIGGAYAKDVLHDQLAAQNISFPASADDGLPADLTQYAGQQVDTAAEARAYADDYIGLHLQEIGGGRTYSEVSAASLANPKDEELAQLTQTLFRGETLRGLLLNAWGWGTIGAIATLAGFVLIGLGLVLLILPILAWAFERKRAPTPAARPVYN